MKAIKETQSGSTKCGGLVHQAFPNMSVQSFLINQYAKWKLKDVPEARREQMTALITKDPQLFKKIGEEIERRKKGGESEIKSSMEVMKKYRAELSALMQKK